MYKISGTKRNGLIELGSSNFNKAVKRALLLSFQGFRDVSVEDAAGIVLWTPYGAFEADRRLRKTIRLYRQRLVNGLTELTELRLLELLADRERHLTEDSLIEETSMQAIQRSIELLARCNGLTLPASEEEK